jgi:putative colanic acid biosynthesis acetyltransferase WcaF
MPWNLKMGAYSRLGPEVDCYNVDNIIIGAHVTVSQKAYLCAASHNIRTSDFALVHAPIVIEDQAWVGADSFVGMGVTIGEGAVIGARAVVFKNVAPWVVMGGNPAKEIAKRIVERKSRSSFKKNEDLNNCQPF